MLHPSNARHRRRPSGRRASRAALLAAALLLAAGACVKNTNSPFSRSRGNADTVELSVENQNFADVRIFREGVQGRESVGFVTGRSSRTFTVSWRQTDAIRFRIEVMAEETYETNEVVASPGDRLQLFIGENPSATFLLRR